MRLFRNYSRKQSKRQIWKIQISHNQIRFVDAPIIDELPFAVECRVKSYDEENWRLVGEIINVSLDERILDGNDKVFFEKFHPIAFDWMNKIYLSLGDKIGDAYRDGRQLK